MDNPVNNISLTVRIPNQLNTELADLAKNLGVTKVSLLRFAIHLFLSEKPTPLLFSDGPTERFRFTFHINKVTYDLLTQAAEQYSVSINSVITSITSLAIKHYSKYL